MVVITLCPVPALESIRKRVWGKNLLVRSEQLIKFVNQMFASFLAAIFVLLGGAQIWRPHSEPYKFLLHILKKTHQRKTAQT